MTCPYCAYALANAGSPCPRCGRTVGGGSPLDRSHPSSRNTRHRPAVPVTPNTPQFQAKPSPSHEAKQMGNVTPLSATLVIGGILGLTYILILLFPEPTPSSASSSPPVAQTQQVAPAPPAIVMSPTFQQVDSMMDDRRIDLTDAQRQQYWSTIAGTTVTWTGTIHNVYLNSGGQMSLQCNPNSILSDVRISLDGTQMSLLPQLRKGQQVTVRAILDNHHAYGYNLVQGQIVN